jgi:hypothetical protein
MRMKRSKQNPTTRAGGTGFSGVDKSQPQPQPRQNPWQNPPGLTNPRHSLIIPLSETPISKATPSELLNSIVSTPPFANRPTQLPSPDVNCTSEKVLSSESFKHTAALSLISDTKNCGIEEEPSEHRAIVINSFSLCGRVKNDGENGRF